MADENRDLVLSPGEYSYVLDNTKGLVNIIVGPNKTSMSATDKIVKWNSEQRKFVVCSMEQAVTAFANAPEGHYMVLENPSENNSHPQIGRSTPSTELSIGRKINLPGPTNFPLWPGQSAKIIEGHRLRSNQYLVVRIYNDDEAKMNWKTAVVKLQTNLSSLEGKNSEEKESPEVSIKDSSKTEVLTPNITMGQLLIIKGTEVSFYIPPTGVEVLPDSNGKYVRDAATLERLEYSILLDEGGGKRFVQGPAVVFPEPTETFIVNEGKYKSRAIELNDISGLYIKVIAEYADRGITHNAGDELFITGKDQAIYFPREEHAIIKYDNQEKHHAVAVPEGEGRYVLNRLTGEVSLVSGPCMLLPDPRKEVIVKRVLDSSIVKLLFPGNQKALEINDALRNAGGVEISSQLGMASNSGSEFTAKSFAGDEILRSTRHTPPRTITLNTKYDGAVSISVWTGYAVMIMDKTGKRRVVIGPNTTLLGYNETPIPMKLSTGTPKNAKNLIDTVYLKVKGNTVSDQISVTTKDLCDVDVTLSYRVNFEGNDEEKWFAVDNYIQLLTEHLRSLLGHVVKQQTIEDFYTNATTIIRDAILGIATNEEGRRGKVFLENSMKIYDVEVLSVAIKDREIAQLLSSSQQDTVRQTLEVAKEELRLAHTKRKQKVERQVATELSKTEENGLALKLSLIGKNMQINLSEIQSQISLEKSRLEADKDRQSLLDVINLAEIKRSKEKDDQRLLVLKSEDDQYIEKLKAEAEALVTKAGGVSPDLIAALQAFGDKELAGKMADSMGALAILGGASVADVLGKLLQGTPLESVVKLMGQRVVVPGVIK